MTYLWTFIVGSLFVLLSIIMVVLSIITDHDKISVKTNRPDLTIHYNTKQEFIGDCHNLLAHYNYTLSDSQLLAYYTKNTWDFETDIIVVIPERSEKYWIQEVLSKPVYSQIEGYEVFRHKGLFILKPRRTVGTYIIQTQSEILESTNKIIVHVSCYFRSNYVKKHNISEKSFKIKHIKSIYIHGTRINIPNRKTSIAYLKWKYPKQLDE